MTDLKDRKTWMGLLASSPSSRLTELWGEAGIEAGFSWLRSPEIGGVMVRGRMGGSGAAFNLGEMTVTRCTLRLDTGEVGHAYVQGREKAKAETAALCDALMQTNRAEQIHDRILLPLAAEIQAAADLRASKAAATKVDFFTMVRGED